MTLTLPSPIDAYVTASNAHDTDALVGLFTEDAVVRDEGRERRGHAAVRAWRAEVEKASTSTIEPRRIAERDGLTVLTATVRGDFPGSPVDLDFAFALRDGRIAGLEIHP
jgi:ketosteroid isomerase-like protein